MENKQTKNKAGAAIEEIQRIGEGFATIERTMANMFPHGGYETVQGFRAYLIDYALASFIANDKDGFGAILKDYVKGANAIFDNDSMKGLLRDTYEKMGATIDEKGIKDNIGLCKQLTQQMYEEFDKLVNNKKLAAKKATKKKSAAKKRGFKDADGNFIEVS